MEPIKLKKSDEKLVFEYPPAKIFYRRIPRSETRQIIKQHTDRRTGKEDWAAISNEMLHHVIIDWEGFDMPYDPAQIDNIPDVIIADFTEELMEGLGSKAAKQKEAEAKN
jgi:hypothetical protein